MKCQKCNFFSSNRWDLCPKCSYDLRPHKQALGLPITNKTASAAELKILEGSSTEGISKSVVRNTSSPQNLTPPLENRSKGDQTQRVQPSVRTPWLKRVLGHGSTQKESRSQENLPPQIPVRQSLEPKRVEDLSLKSAKVTLAKEPLLQPKQLAEHSHSQESLQQKNTVTAAPEAKADGSPTLNREPSLKQKPLQEEKHFQSPWENDILEDSSVSPQPSFEDLSEMNFDSSFDEAVPSESLLRTSLVSKDAETNNFDLPEEHRAYEVRDHEDDDNDSLFPKKTFSSSSDLPLFRAEPTTAPQVVEFGDDDELLEEQLDKLLGDDILNVTSVKAKPVSWSRSTHSDHDRFLSKHEEEVEFEFEIESSTENEDEQGEVTFPFPSQEDLPVPSKGFVLPNTQKAALPSPPERFTEENDQVLGGLIAAFGTLDAGVAHVDISPSPQNILMKSEILPGQSTSFSPQVVQHRESQTLERGDSHTLQRLLSTVHAQEQLLHELIVLVSEVYGIDQKVLTEEETLRVLGEELDVELEQLLCEGTTFVQEDPHEEIPAVETLQKEILNEQPVASSQVEDGMGYDALEELLQEYNQLAASHLQSLGEDVREHEKPPDPSLYEPPGDTLERQWHSIEESKKKRN